MGDATMVLLDFLTEPLREGISTEGTLAPEPLSIPSLSFSLFPLGGDGDLSKYWHWRRHPRVSSRRFVAGSDIVVVQLQRSVSRVRTLGNKQHNIIVIYRIVARSFLD